MAQGTFDAVALRPGWFDTDVAFGGAFDHDLARDFVAPVIPGRGPEGVATLVLDIADSATTTYSFATDVIRSLSGREQRISLIGCPRETYTLSSTMLDSEMAQLQSDVAYDGSQGADFQVGLTYEAITLSSTTVGVVVSVGSTAMADWCYPGSRVVIVDADNGARLNAVIQSSTATTITLDETVGDFGEVGNLIMPAIPCFLESEQRLGQNAVNAGRLDLRARAQIFGDANNDWSPVGGPAVTTYTDPVTAINRPVWDRRISVEDQSGRAIALGSEIVDRGGKLRNHGPQRYSDFVRSVRLVVDDDSTRQWFKKFIGVAFGRRHAWLLPTWKPDLVISSGDASTGTIKVFGPPTVGGVDYAGKYKDKSLAHKWLQIWKADGTVAYRTISDSADNGDGTQDVLLDSAVVGAIQMVSFLELARFDSDDFVVNWQNTLGYFEGGARVVQR